FRDGAGHARHHRHILNGFELADVIVPVDDIPSDGIVHTDSRQLRRTRLRLLASCKRQYDDPEKNPTHAGDSAIAPRGLWSLRANADVCKRRPARASDVVSRALQCYANLPDWGMRGHAQSAYRLRHANRLTKNYAARRRVREGVTSCIWRRRLRA